MKTLKFDVFGRDVAIVKTESGWQAFYSGSEGKRRPARDIIVPSNITEIEMTQYLDDLCHEWATDRNKNVNRVD
jgi:NAD(P)H-nitrite reductase large subunit